MKKSLLSIAMLFVAVAFVFGQPCTKPFFSEYIEGSSNNKALEIYNPTTLPINLANYKILQWRNGVLATSNTITLSGSVPPMGTYVICHPNADSVSIKVKAQLITGNCNYNGDDALALVDGIDTLDIIGIRRDSAVWLVDTADTKDNTLIRKSAVQGGNVNWTTAKLEWLAFPTNNASNLGLHTATPCVVTSPDTITAITTSASLTEGTGVYNLKLYLNKLQPFPKR